MSKHTDNFNALTIEINHNAYCGHYVMNTIPNIDINIIVLEGDMCLSCKPSFQDIVWKRLDDVTVELPLQNAVIPDPNEGLWLESLDGDLSLNNPIVWQSLDIIADTFKEPVLGDYVGVSYVDTISWFNKRVVGILGYCVLVVWLVSMMYLSVASV